MKCLCSCCCRALAAGRSREGAWIEIPASESEKDYNQVAPARERGLKCQFQIMVNQPSTVAPARERGLKCHGTYNREGSASRRSREGAWIEIATNSVWERNSPVAPARERGLK